MLGYKVIFSTVFNADCTATTLVSHSHVLMIMKVTVWHWLVRTLMMVDMLGGDGCELKVMMEWIDD